MLYYYLTDIANRK